MGCWGRWVLLPKLLSLRAVPWGGGILGLPWRQKHLAAPVPSPVTLQAHKTPSPGSLTRNRTAWGRDGDVCYVWGARKSVSHERVQIGEENTEPGKANQQVVLKTEREVRPESEQIMAVVGQVLPLGCTWPFALQPRSCFVSTQIIPHPPKKLFYPF